ncbi:hypothetical protein H257_16314 [Aphanomyces astaci]|nr:hypothetical protein H257_16314 [Aphanomyces astaci]ETV67433.1 hypothetical protein H257_16314 [Aphanomyces astaci]|eukprot:XP_009842992.1 hypothetical protein H257_16314 [Aphanomyces astaci]
MPPTFTVRDTTSLPFVPTASPMSRSNRDADSYPSSAAHGQPHGVGYTQPSPGETGSGLPLRPPIVRIPVVEGHSPGAATGVVTQVERILPHPLEVARIGVIMVDPSGAEVTLRDLLVVEDPAGTTVVPLALREADPEETSLVTDSPTHPWSPVRLHVRPCPMLGSTRPSSIV